MAKKNKNIYKRAPTKVNKKLEQAVSNKRYGFFNTGYSETGASMTRSALKGWNSPPSSPDSDIIANLSVLRGRSRGLRMGGAPIAGAAINTSRVNVIGAGLNLSASPDKFVLGLSVQEAREWGRKAQKEFDLWASSVSCDALRMNNFYDMQDIIFTGYLDNGDGWAVFKYEKPLPDMPYALRLHIIEADRIRNPNETESLYGSTLNIYDKNPKNGNQIISGVEINQKGMIVAFWIADTYSYDPQNMLKQPTFKRVEAFGRITGLPNILQVKHDERAEQYRGTPYLAPVIESLKQLGRYTNAELAAAIIKAYLTVFVTREVGAHSLGIGIEQAYEEDERIDPLMLQLGMGTINSLPPGHDVKAIDGGRTMSAFEPFMTELVKGIGANLNIPYEVLTKHFTSSYSAARAALLQGWQEFRTRRTWFVRDFCEPVYRRWLSEAVAIGRIEAPGFFDDPLIQAAWSKSNWYGPVPGQIDAVKEVKAAALKVAYGFSTYEKETRELGGGEHEENIETIGQEIENMRANGIEITKDIEDKGGEIDADLDNQK